jgi:hypothetical protein
MKATTATPYVLEQKKEEKGDGCHRLLCCVVTKQTKKMLKGGNFLYALTLNPTWVPLQALQLQ